MADIVVPAPSDDLGVPFHSFPPFPDTSGIKLVSFKDFKPLGIHVPIDPDEPECDGSGIPTVRLGVSHATDGVTRKGKKKNRKKVGASGARIPWWEEWEDALSTKKSTFNPMSDRVDRMHELAADFASHVSFTPGLQSIYDHLRIYLGLLGRSRNKNHHYSGDKAAPEGGMSDDEDDEDGPPTRADTRFLETEEELEQRMDRFFDEPEESMKIFFSSYFRDKGLIWSEAKLRDGPLLVSIFLSYAIRHSAFPEYTRELKKALEVTELAKIELPAVRSISLAISEEKWSKACTVLWGQLGAIDWTFPVENVEPEPAPAQESDPPKVELVTPEQIGLQLPAETEVASGQEIKLDVDAEIGLKSGWGASPSPPNTDWATAPVAAGWDDAPNPWGDTEDTTMAVDWLGTPQSFLPLVGPASFPLTQAPMRVEKSTRRILAVSPPLADPTTSDSNSHLLACLGMLTLGPWTTLSTNPDTAVPPPEMARDLTEGTSEAGGSVRPHDPNKDEIQVLIEPSSVDAFRVGMGMTGVWVQVLDKPTSGGTAEGAGDAASSPKKSKKKKSKNKSGGGPQGWWYAESVHQVIPSYWLDSSDQV
ncbi:hypothetical protein BOTBODRAFT_150912 [Botryobasidium botryosum FD-172 SS1]|uniref:Uncharacterized protein n=1 Tax=Botryobasidium botryosum (strain FD-172 SS1) TaxID=930990 RepID=A0A067NCR2_BOTB1|nr:hypothetical protein BOTBODRAFT_150912 [Botryobasidium botryosum FD-172 SS1]